MIYRCLNKPKQVKYNVFNISYILQLICNMNSIFQICNNSNIVKIANFFKLPLREKLIYLKTNETVRQ